MPCHYCGSDNVIEFHKSRVNDGFGIFDKNMITLSLYYGTWIPKYFWNRNAGYGTKKHIENIYRFGPTIHHRKTFEPIKSLIHS